MYKKLICAFCVVISLFIIVPIFYILWNRESVQAFQVKGPFISIFQKNQYKNSVYNQILHDIPNSQFILDSTGWNVRPNASEKTPIRKSLRLECYANVPIKWDYDGIGVAIVDAKNLNKREIKSFDDRDTYWFESVLEFFTISEQITGKYVCKAMHVPELEVFVAVFAKGEQVFLTDEEIRSTVEPDEYMIVSCPLTSPSSSIALKEVIQPLDRILLKHVDPKGITLFDPLLGFKLVPNLWGSYMCVDESTGQTSGVVRLYKPLRFAVNGDYVTRSSINVAQNDTSLKVLCEATEDVTLKFINFLKFSRKQVYFKNESSSFLFTTRIKLRTEWFRNHSVVHCLTSVDNRILRIWEFVSDQWSETLYFRFENGSNGNSKGYECCLDDPASTPKLNQSPCYTQTECEFRKQCLQSVQQNKCLNSASNFKPVYEGKKPGCALAKVEDTPSGLLQCSYANSSKSYMYFYNQGTGFQNYTSTDFRKKKVPVESILRVVQRKSQEKLSQTDEVTFDCYGAKFFLASGFQWALKSRNGTLDHILNQIKSDEESPEEIHEWIQLPVKDVVSRTLLCIAPLIHSQYEWMEK